MIINKVVSTGPALSVPSHLSFGQYAIDKLRQHCEEDAVAIVSKYLQFKKSAFSCIDFDLCCIV